MSATILDNGRGGVTHVHPSGCEVSLPEGMLTRMKGNDWNERNQAITELEMFILKNNNGLGSNIVKVNIHVIIIVHHNINT